MTALSIKEETRCLRRLTRLPSSTIFVSRMTYSRLRMRTATSQCPRQWAACARCRKLVVRRAHCSGYALIPAGTARPTGCRLGRYKLHDFTFFGHVALDAAVPALLQELGHGWRPADPVLGADRQAVAAVWRDSHGNVFLPFDPGEVMQRFWSEEYRNVGRSALIAIVHAVSLRGYYLLRPVLPRPLQLQLRRVFTRAQGRSSFPRMAC